MTKLGKNVKLTIAETHRARVSQVFTRALGATAVTPPGQTSLEVYKLEGSQIGAFYVPAAEALSPADQRKGAWLELDVPDVAGAQKALDALEVERVAYADTAHAYYQLPGGPVFRLAKAD